MKNLYSNIGKKIMMMSQIVAILMMVAGVVCGFVFIGWGYEEAVLGGLAIVIASPFVAYISSMCLYAFGKLVQSTESIDYKLGVTTAPIIDDLPEL